MPVQVTIEQIVRLAPSIRSSHREAFRLGQAVFDTFGISESALRVAHFMAQILHESGAFTVQFENLYYSPQRLPKVWPKRFKPNGPLDPAKYAYNPQKLANEVYGGRMGNIGPNDGFTYRGRGLLQLTGRDSYAEATAILRQSFPEAPDFTFGSGCRHRCGLVHPSSRRGVVLKGMQRTGRPRRDPFHHQSHKRRFDRACGSY